MLGIRQEERKKEEEEVEAEEEANWLRGWNEEWMGADERASTGRYLSWRSRQDQPADLSFFSRSGSDKWFLFPLFIPLYFIPKLPKFIQINNLAKSVGMIIPTFIRLGFWEGETLSSHSGMMSWAGPTISSLTSCQALYPHSYLTGYLMHST